MNQTKTIIIGADHAGFVMKEKLKPLLVSLGYRVIDKGAKKVQPTDDYPDFAVLVARAVARQNAIGILVCGSSHGVCIVANKIRGVRAVAVLTTKDAKKTREDNDANVLCLSGWNTSLAVARLILRAFLTTPFSNAVRHRRRVKKISQIEKRTMKSFS